MARRKNDPEYEAALRKEISTEFAEKLLRYAREFVPAGKYMDAEIYKQHGIKTKRNEKAGRHFAAAFEGAAGLLTGKLGWPPLPKKRG